MYTSLSRHEWRTRIADGYQLGHITRAWRDVLFALCDLGGGPFGLFVSQETIARRAKVSLSTVKRALAWARSEGFLRSTKHRVPTEDGRTRWSTCDYELMLPNAPLAELPRPHHPFKQWQERRDVGRQLRLALRRPSVAQADRGLLNSKMSPSSDLWITRINRPHPPIRTVAEQLAMLREG